MWLLSQPWCWVSLRRLRNKNWMFSLELLQHWGCRLCYCFGREGGIKLRNLWCLLVTLFSHSVFFTLHVGFYHLKSLTDFLQHGHLVSSWCPSTDSRHGEKLLFSSRALLNSHFLTALTLRWMAAKRHQQTPGTSGQLQGNWAVNDSHLQGRCRVWCCPPQSRSRYLTHLQIHSCCL